MSLKDELKKTGKKVAPILAATVVALTPNAAKGEENNTPIEKGVKIEQVSKQQSRTQLEEKDTHGDITVNGDIREILEKQGFLAKREDPFAFNIKDILEQNEPSIESEDPKNEDIVTFYTIKNGPAVVRTPMSEKLYEEAVQKGDIDPLSVSSVRYPSEKADIYVEHFLDENMNEITRQEAMKRYPDFFAKRDATKKDKPMNLFVGFRKNTTIKYRDEAYNFASKEADIKDGTMTFEDGSKIEQESTAGGNRVTKVYRADGSLEEKIERSSGGKDSFYEYDKDGFLKQVVEVNAENGFHYEYDKIGRLRQYGELGLKITSYNRDGSKQIEERKEGENMEEFKSKEFYPNGNLKSEIYYKVEGKDLDRAQQRLEAFNNNESLPGYGYEKVYTEKGEQSGEVYYVNGKKIVEHGELSDKDINTSDLVKYAWNRSIDTLDQEVVQRIKDMFTLSKKTEEVQNMQVKTAAINKIKNMR